MVSQTEKQNPLCCKHVVRVECFLTCVKGKKYTREKCVNGAGECDARMYRFKGPAPAAVAGPQAGDIIQRPHGRHARVISVDGHFIQLDYPRTDDEKPTVRRWIRIPRDYTVIDHG